MKDTLISLWQKLRQKEEAEEKKAFKQLNLKQKKKKIGLKNTLTGKQLFLQDPSLWENEKLGDYEE